MFDHNISHYTENQDIISNIQRIKQTRVSQKLNRNLEERRTERKYPLTAVSDLFRET